MSPVEPYEFRAGSTPGQGLWVHRNRLAIPESGIVTPPPPPPPPAGALVWDRSMYPGPGSTHPRAATAEFQALGDWRTWDKAYWLPSGSTYPVPTGVQAIYGHQPHWSTIQNKRLRIKCPEVFVNPPGQLLIENGSAVIHGLRMRRDTWDVITPLTNPDGTEKPMTYGAVQSQTAPSLRNAVFFTWKGGGSSKSGEFRALERAGVLPDDNGFLKIMEFIDYDRKTDLEDTTVWQNVRCANDPTNQGLSHVNWGEVGDHYQGDLFQPIKGAQYRYGLGFVGVSTYQGVFDQSRVTGSYQRYERLWIRGDRGTHGGVGGEAYLWWDAMRNDATIQRNWGAGDNGVYVDPTDGSRRTLYNSSSSPDAYSGIVIGAAPRDFVPLSSIATINLNDDPDGDAWDF